MKKPLILVISIFFMGHAFGQSHKTDSISKSEISKLAFMVGEWKGQGWMMRAGGVKSEFNQKENIQFKLDSTAILIEGVGKTKGKVIHNAMAIVSYNKQESNYTFQSYLQNGRKGEFKGELIDEKFYWYPNENIRYIIALNEKDQWSEIGQMLRNGSWYQFFEMILSKE